MAYPKSLAIALSSLRRNRLQTILTTLGMMIGVGTVLVMVAVGSGAEQSISTQVRAAGMNVIEISSGNYRMPQQWTSQGEGEQPAAWLPGSRLLLNDAVFRPPTTPLLRRVQGIPIPGSDPGSNPIQNAERDPSNFGGLGAATTLHLADADAIAALHGVQTVSAGVHENVTLDTGTTRWTTEMRGEQSSLPAIRRAWILPHGRFFTTREDDAHAPVAVLGSVAGEHLFGTANPVGQTITLRGTPFRVIGVLASGSWMVPSATGDHQFDAIYIPVQTAQHLLARPYLDTILLATASTGDVTRLTKQISAELRQRHHLGPSTPDDFTVASQARTAIARGGMRTDISRAMIGNADNLDKVTLAQLSKTLEQAGRTMAVLLASIAAVSLIVGGIGIMNIMLVSVTERTREIGIRRAVGAQSAEVMQQFLLEAILLSLGGGLLGILLGSAAAALVARLGGWSVELSWIAIVVSFTLSAAIGVLFGYYPARQASRLSPMNSLRYE